MDYHRNGPGNGAKNNFTDYYRGSSIIFILDDAHPIARTPTPVAVEEVRASQEEDEPVREPTPKPATPEPETYAEAVRSRTSSGSASVSTCSSVSQNDRCPEFPDSGKAGML